VRPPDSVVLLRRAATCHYGATAQGGEDGCNQALADMGDQARYNQLRDQIMNTTECSKRTAQLAISEACQRGVIVQTNGQYRLPLQVRCSPVDCYRLSARDRARADAQGRCDGAGSEEIG